LLLQTILFSTIVFYSAREDIHLGSSFRLLIIGPEDIRSIAEDYADYKCRTGTASGFVSIEEIDGRFTGADLAEKIRKFIRYFKENLGIEYVLLLGDFGRLPSRVAYIRLGSDPVSNNVPTDFYYFELLSDWDRNKNGIYGEMEDSISLIPGIKGGRIPYHNVNELVTFFEKLKSYKEMVPDSPKLLSHCSDVLGNGSSYLMAEDVSSSFPAEIQKSRLYEMGSTVNVTKQQFIDSVNSSPSYIYSCVHGDFGNLYINQTPQVSFGLIDLRLLHSTPAFWGILSCDVGGFDRDAFAEHLLFNPSCVGILTQTRDGISTSNSFFVKFFSELFRDPFLSIGEADSAMHSSFAELGRNSILVYYSLLTYCLLGDPTLVPQKSSYRSFRFSDIRVVGDTLLVVKVNPMGSFSEQVPKRFVLYKRGEFISVVETEGDSVVFSLNPQKPGYLYVSLTGPYVNDIFDSIFVTPYSLPVSYEIESVSNEFGDSIIVSNARFKIGLGIKNNSSKELRDISVWLVGDEDVTLFDSVLSFKLGPYEEHHFNISGRVSHIDGERYLKIEFLTQSGERIRRDTVWLDVNKLNLRVPHFRALRKRDFLVFDVKIANPSRVSVRDIKLYSKADCETLLAYIREISAFRDTSILESIPLPVTFPEIKIYFGNDSIFIPVGPGNAILPNPSNLTVSPGPGIVNLAWQSPYQGLVFNVYKSVDGVEFQRINEDLVNQLTFSDRYAGSVAYYCVTAVDTIFRLESKPSETVSCAPNPPYFLGWPQSTPGTGYSTPVACELDASITGLEVVIATSFDSLVYAFAHSGNILNGWPVNVSGTVLSALAAGDLNNDGEEEIVLNIWNGAYKLHALNKYGLELNGFPVNLAAPGYSTPALMDLNGDSIPEIVLKDGNYLKVFGSGGGLIASSYLGGAGTSPACGDLDGDGIPEIVVSYSTSTSGYVTVLTANLSPKPGFPFAINKNNITSPSIGELWPAESGYEIAVCSGDSLYVISSAGTLLTRTYTGSLTSWPFAISPALADVDGDGLKDIAIPYSGGIKVYRSDGTILSGFPANCGGGFSSCTIYDIDGDGRGEILKGSVDSKLYVYNFQGNGVPGFPVDLFSYAYVTPQVVDLNADNKFEILVSSWANSVVVYNTRWWNSISNWPMYKHDRNRTAWAEYSELTKAPQKPKTFSGSEKQALFPSTMQVYDVSGRMVYNGPYRTFKWLTSEGFKKGVYFVKIEGMSEVLKEVVIK